MNCHWHRLHRQKRGKRTGEAGFTVVELLVALAVFALVTSLLFGSVRFGFAAWQKGSARADETDRITIEYALLQRLIREAYPQFVRTNDLRGYVDFDGEKQSLKFLASAPHVLGTGGRFRFALSVVRHDGRAALGLEAEPELAARKSQSEGSKRRLLRNVNDIEFAYFGRSRDGRSLEWQDSWRGRLELPQLVRIRVSSSDQNLDRWPDLTVAPRVSADVSCVLDVLSGRCAGR